MRLLRTLVALFAAATTLFTLGAVTARADVYTTPGGHDSGGRLWRTECGSYSSTVIRCRTEIWATVVTFSGGRYTHTTRWTFNNLTYLASPEHAWAGNPLAHTNEWTAADGRRWRTECRTPATGGDACHSYAQARVARATATPTGWAFSVNTQWVLNNIVIFSSPTRPWVSTVPRSVLEESKLTHTGFGPIQLGTSMTDLQRLGYVRWVDSDVCQYWDPTSSLREMGIQLLVADGKVDTIIVDSDRVQTSRNLRVGDTFEQASRLYADARFHHDMKAGYEPVYTYASDRGPNEMVFMRSFMDTTFPDLTGEIRMIIVRENTGELIWDGC